MRRCFTAASDAAVLMAGSSAVVTARYLREEGMRLRFNVLSIDYVRVINCFNDYDYDYVKYSACFCLSVCRSVSRIAQKVVGEL